MKNIRSMKNILVLILLSVVFKTNAQTSAIVLDTNKIISSCNLGSFGIMTVKVPSEALTGDNIPLNITLPPTASTCVTKVTVTTSANLNFVSSVTPFVGSGTTYANAAVIDPINGRNFNVMYRFPSGITCNGVIGKFSVTVETNCNGIISTCTATVNCTARAANYWTIKTAFVAGNLTCGNSYWRIYATHNNSNGAGLGAYKLLGTFTDVASVQVLSPLTPILVNLPPNYNGSYSWDVVLKNCQPVGTTITNTVNYNLVLGDIVNNCGTMVGSRVDTVKLDTPKPGLSFTKTAYDNIWGYSVGSFTEGCKGVYYLRISNTGNTPWNNFTITDNLTIPGIAVTSIGLPSGWTQSPVLATSGPVSFSGPVSLTYSGVLLPNQSISIPIYFTITGTPSSLVTNTASLSYFGGTGSIVTPGSDSICAGIICPAVSSAIQNTSATSNFTIVQAKPKPSIIKCNEPNSLSPPIVQVGSIVKFHIQVTNSGSKALDTIVTDNLGTPLQNLSIIGTPTYTYYANATSASRAQCVSFSQTANGVNGAMYCNMTGLANNPIFNVKGLPGNCEFGITNTLVIEYEAIVLPQLSGSKINKAFLGAQQSSSNYTIDKVAELKIRKVADAQYVENGSSFNYIITVTNVGSYPLDHVVVKDNLPTCVQKTGAVVVTKGGLIVTNTTLSNLIITVNPLTIINPGESFVITIPVKKINGSTCCNDSASASANMLVDLTKIGAKTPLNEPACVTSSLCCDMPAFKAEFIKTTNNNSGTYYLNVSAGTTPIQEVEVSMVDYHVTYSNPECKPANMGVFGTIYSPNNALTGGLLINNNNTHSINWGLGSPVILNQIIQLNISKPAILKLDCCSGIMYFCLKIRIKDVNCNVCEKMVCGSFNINKNVIIWTPPNGDFSTEKFSIRNTSNNNIQLINDIQINPLLKDKYEKMIEEQVQINLEQTNLRAEQIDKAMNEIDPANRQAFIEFLNANKYLDVINSVNIFNGNLPSIK